MKENIENLKKEVTYLKEDLREYDIYFQKVAPY